MTHLSREELKRWWEEGPAEERERIVGHLAVCDECGALYGGLIDGWELDNPKPATESRPELAARGYRAYRPRGSGVLSLPPLLWGAAAAALLVALGVLTLRAPGLGDDPGAIRGASLQPLSPIGRVDPPFDFRWESPVRAFRYRIEIVDAERRSRIVLYSEVESIALSPDRLEELEPGMEYAWFVVALDESGEEIMRAPLRLFSVSPESR
jgi:hypothetical protein